MADLVSEMVASKEIRFERGDLRECSYRDFRNRAERFRDGFSGRIASEVTVTKIKEWLLGLGNRSPRTTRNDLAVIGELFRYAVQKRYVSFSPLDELTDVDRKELCGSNPTTEPAILTPSDAESLLNAALAHQKLGMLAAVTLGLFCGLRTEEIKRLEWETGMVVRRPATFTVSNRAAKI
jgi:integrase